jgi:hypothetical protein
MTDEQACWKQAAGKIARPTPDYKSFGTALVVQAAERSDFIAASCGRGSVDH